MDPVDDPFDSFHNTSQIHTVWSISEKKLFTSKITSFEIEYAPNVLTYTSCHFGRGNFIGYILYIYIHIHYMHISKIQLEMI